MWPSLRPGRSAWHTDDPGAGALRANRWCNLYVEGHHHRRLGGPQHVAITCDGTIAFGFAETDIGTARRSMLGTGLVRGAPSMVSARSLRVPHRELVTSSRPRWVSNSSTASTGPSAPILASIRTPTAVPGRQGLPAGPARALSSGCTQDPRLAATVSTTGTPHPGRTASAPPAPTVPGAGHLFPRHHRHPSPEKVAAISRAVQRRSLWPSSPTAPRRNRRGTAFQRPRGRLMRLSRRHRVVDASESRRTRHQNRCAPEPLAAAMTILSWACTRAC